MNNVYSHCSAKSTRSHYIALAKRLAASPIMFVGINETLRRRLLLAMEERGLSVNETGKKADIRESSIRAILNGKTASATIGTVEKLANGLEMDVADLLGVERQPVKEELLVGLLKRLLRPLFHQESLVDQIAQSLLQAYAIGLDIGADPKNPRDLDMLTGLEVDRLQRANKKSK